MDDYLLFNSDGSIRQSNLNQYVQEGDNNKQVLVAVIGLDSGTELAQAICRLPNGQSVVLAGVWNADEHGWIFTFTSSVTLYYGVVLVAIRISENGINRVMFPFSLMVNQTGVNPNTDTGISLEELDAYLLTIKNWINALNIENGTGVNSAQQKRDTTSVNFTGRNANAESLDPTLSDTFETGASGEESIALNGNTMAMAKRSMANGNKTIAKGEESHAEGYQSVTLADGSHAEGQTTVSAGVASHSEGHETQAIGNNAHSEGYQTNAYSAIAHSEGVQTTVKDNYIIVDTGETPEPVPTPTPEPSTDEQKDAVNGMGAHSEGHSTYVLGCGAHAEGDTTKAYGRFSHSEGRSTITGELIVRKTEDGKDYYTPNQNKQFQHAEGESTHAIGHASHTGGLGTIANYDYQTVVGTFNDNKSDTLFEVGNGNGIEDDANERRNAFEVHSDGRATVMGTPTNSNDVVRLSDSKLYIHKLRLTGVPTTFDLVIVNKTPTSMTTFTSLETYIKEAISVSVSVLYGDDYYEKLAFISYKQGDNLYYFSATGVSSSFAPNGISLDNIGDI